MNIAQKLAIYLVFSFVAIGAIASEVPTGLVRSADTLKTNTYEFVLSPTYTFKPDGAYLSSEVRYQANEDFGAGLAFGAGEAGFHVGLNGMWYIFPDMESQPGVSILGGIYLNRLDQTNYFNVKVAPMVSKAFATSFGKFTPYAGLHLTPSFRLREPENQLCVKTSFGSQFTIRQLNGMQLFVEGGVGIANSPHMINIAASYPFVALGE